jgi:SnoaL-like domain
MTTACSNRIHRCGERAGRSPARHRAHPAGPHQWPCSRTSSSTTRPRTSTAKARSPLDGDRATGESYTIAHHLFSTDGERKIMVAALRYLDTFTKVDGNVAVRRAPTHPRLERDTLIPAMNQQMPARRVRVSVRTASPDRRAGATMLRESRHRSRRRHAWQCAVCDVAA